VPEFIVFQEIPEEQVIDQPMPVAAFVVRADNAKSAIHAVAAFQATFLSGMDIGAAPIDDRESYAVSSSPKLTKKPKP